MKPYILIILITLTILGIMVFTLERKPEPNYTPVQNYTPLPSPAGGDLPNNAGGKG